jgi:hypothetical protein
LRRPDFIGIGAQRTGTSWMYACLYEHPQICMPRKEINFFSRDRNWRRGYEWYETIFSECPATATTGEFSTSYLPDAKTPTRIRDRYPEARLIASLRHPVDRAYSSYLNDLSDGVVSTRDGFWEASQSRPEYVEAGRYARQLRNFLDVFPREQLLVLFFEDARRDPLAVLRRAYGFLGVDPTFRPTMLGRRVGAGRVPRSQRIERWLLDSSAALRKRRSTRSVWWAAKRLGLGDRVRAVNTRSGALEQNGLSLEDRRSLIECFEADIEALEALLQRKLPEWRR